VAVRVKFRALLSLTLVAALWADIRAAAPPGFSEDFEAYANQAAFAASWSATGSPPHTLDTAFGFNSSCSLKLVPQTTNGGTSNRWYKNLATPLLATDTAPVLFSFDFYLDPAGAATNWAQDWQQIDIRAFSGGTFGAGTLDGLVAIGVSNPGSLSADTTNTTFYQGRVLTTTRTGTTYNTLDQLGTAAHRSNGWHSLSARIGGTQTLFSIDSLPAETVNATMTTPFSTVVLGSDLSSIRPFWVDNIQLQIVPEPAGAGLISTLIIAALVPRRNRTKRCSCFAAELSSSWRLIPTPAPTVYLRGLPRSVLSLEASISHFGAGTDSIRAKSINTPAVITSTGISTSIRSRPV
jgi:hypothetical protein